MSKKYNVAEMEKKAEKAVDSAITELKEVSAGARNEDVSKAASTFTEAKDDRPKSIFDEKASTDWEEDKTFTGRLSSLFRWKDKRRRRRRAQGGGGGEGKHREEGTKLEVGKSKSLKKKRLYWIIAVAVGLFCLALVIALVVLAMRPGGLTGKLMAKATAEIKEESSNSTKSKQLRRRRGFLAAYPQNSRRNAKIVFSSKNMAQITSSIENLLREYKMADKSKYSECNFKSKAPKDATCWYDPSGLLGPHYKTNFSYEASSDQLSSPFFLLRLENTKLWKPRSSKRKLKDPDWAKVYSDNHVAVTCEYRIKDAKGVSNKGPIVVTPKYGFPFYYFPASEFNSTTAPYLPPLVMVKFENAQSGVDIHATCQARAGNVYKLRTAGKVNINFRVLSGGQNVKKPARPSTTENVPITTTTPNPPVEVSTGGSQTSVPVTQPTTGSSLLQVDNSTDITDNSFEEDGSEDSMNLMPMSNTTGDDIDLEFLR